MHSERSLKTCHVNGGEVVNDDVSTRKVLYA